MNTKTRRCGVRRRRRRRLARPRSETTRSYYVLCARLIRKHVVLLVACVPFRTRENKRVGSRRPDENGEKNGRRRRQHVLTKATFRDRRIPKTSDKRRRRRRITVCGERQNFSPYSCGRRGAQEVPFPRVRRVYLGFAWNVWRDDHGDFWSNARIDFFFNDTSGRRFQHASRVV